MQTRTRKTLMTVMAYHSPSRHDSRRVEISSWAVVKSDVRATFLSFAIDSMMLLESAASLGNRVIVKAAVTMWSTPTLMEFRERLVTYRRVRKTPKRL